MRAADIRINDVGCFTRNLIRTIEPAIWKKSKPPVNLFTNHRILNCYCVACGTDTPDARLHLSFEIIGKLVLTFIGRWQAVVECRSQFGCWLKLISSESISGSRWSAVLWKKS